MRKTQNTIWLVLACLGLLLAGCTSEPPFVESKSAILQLPLSTETVWARSLQDKDLALLHRLPKLSDIDFYAGWKDPNTPARFSDAGLATLVSLQLPHLTSLFFGHCTNITDASLTHIAQIKTVTFLGLVACPRITDAGLQTLSTMQNLTELDLRGCTNITDTGLQYLRAKTNWHRIELGGCIHVSFEAVAKLQRHFPKASIKRDDEEWSLEQ